MRTALVVLFLLALVLVWFNPGMDEFAVFAEAQSEQILLREAGDGTFGRLLSGIGGTIAGQYVDRVTERENYLLFSTYTVDLDGPDETANEWRFLGIAGRFIVLDEPEALAEPE